MKNIYLLFLGSLLSIACSTDLDEVPPNVASADSLTDFEGVLNAAYYYQLGAATPMAVMGDFRADNALMQESPYTEFDVYGPGLTAMEDQFFGPFYTALYKSILSSNNVIENSDDATQIGEAKFLRALSYFKLVQVFGDVTVILTSPDIEDIPTFDLARQSADQVYNTVIVPDLQDAIAALDNSGLGNGRATDLAARGILGKVYMTMGNFGSAEPLLAAVVNGAGGAGVSLQENFEDIFVSDLNSEIIFATQKSSSIVDEYGFSEFWEWSFGLDTKALDPLDLSLVEAFDNSPGDLRRAVTIDLETLASPKFPQSDGPEHDWIELRLADVMLLYAEAMNEN
ncbi:MAG TPA: RagB/SusD family nutrient uptake outer membrane protein, partial [Flavobacteriaceae bacterium]|nr:RagB/SusD family nutrient uptake outer membrane protein [Flavobacteriaceae bacterium]